ncbi:MAG: ABC transporter ATP-binding protein [Candidatus Cloacimonetes bacterium]|nr:ABC transporter ATP-binding protein [Candidatus Cloacimonadota bacterium]
MSKQVKPSRKDPLIQIDQLSVHFHTDKGVVPSVNKVSYEIYPGETLGLVGESGCGKSVTAHSLIGLIPKPAGRIAHGRIMFRGEDLARVTEKRMREIRGGEIAMIFQEPMTSLNPVYTVGDQIMEAILQHTSKSWEEAKVLAIEMLRKVGIPSPEVRVDEYPHQLSGGMKQRVMIAMALSCNPSLLIADEPTTALDVTIQAQILELMQDLQKQSDMSILLITHDLSVVAEVCDRVVVMYGSRIVETATVLDLFERPLHPYTIGLFESIPRVDDDKPRLTPIPGFVPNPLYFPSGCKFHNRCPRADNRCTVEEPELREVVSGHKVACHHVEDPATGNEKLDDLLRI